MFAIVLTLTSAAPNVAGLAFKKLNAPVGDINISPFMCTSRPDNTHGSWSRLGEISGRFKGPPSVAEVPILQGVGVSKSYCLRIVPEAPTAYARVMLWVFTPNRAFVMPLGWADQDPPPLVVDRTVPLFPTARHTEVLEQLTPFKPLLQSRHETL